MKRVVFQAYQSVIQINYLPLQVFTKLRAWTSHSPEKSENRNAGLVSYEQSFTYFSWSF